MMNRRNVPLIIAFATVTCCICCAFIAAMAAPFPSIPNTRRLRENLNTAGAQSQPCRIAPVGGTTTFGSPSTTSAITSSPQDFYTYNSGLQTAYFNYLGGNYVQGGLTSPSINIASPVNAFNPNDARFSMIEFMTDSPAFELRIRGTGKPWRIWVDGTAQTQQSALTSDNLIYYCPISFATRAVRRIQVEVGAATFQGVRLGQTDAIWSPQTPRPIRCLFFGDSYIEGTGMTLRTLAIPWQMAKLAGVDVWPSGSGGTGYVVNGSNGQGKANLLERIAPPYNSWNVILAGASGGTFTMTYGGQTTASLANNSDGNARTVNLGGATGGTFSLTVTNASGSATLSSIAYNASTSTIQTGLNALTIGGVSVGATVDSSSGSLRFGFNDATIIVTANGSGLTGGSGVTLSATVTSALSALSTVGVGNVAAYGLGNSSTQGAAGYLVLFKNSLASATDALTASGAGLSGSTTINISRNQGDLVSNIPVDGNGGALPFYVIISGGYNDVSYSTQVQARVTSLISSIQSSAPTATILCVGPWVPATASGNLTSTITAVSTACSSANVPFLNMNGTITGSSTSDSTGNAQYYIGGDNVHPNDAGHNYLADRLTRWFIQQTYLAN